MRLETFILGAVLLFLQILNADAVLVVPEGRRQQQLLREDSRVWDGRELEEVGEGGGRGLVRKAAKRRTLKGKFLHITDVHPDPLYRYHSSVAHEEACHRGKGPAGVYGAEVTDCDSPFALVNATFKWIAENIRDEIDFVIWTGDSARHDNDELHPRDEEQLKTLNQFVVDKFFEVWGNPPDNDDDPTNAVAVPIVPTYGNNDILPHNIFTAGPNKWTRAYLDIWRNFIPEEQRHSFEIGGWFYVEVIPGRLAVFSLNSLYFFDNNAAVDGCATRGEPGYRQFEWLRIQLAFLRAKGMKAIITGHVPPARTESKTSWDETCWQRYALWMRQYRDVVVGSLWGHMNIDHFMLQDARNVDIALLEEDVEYVRTRTALDDEMSAESTADYLKELRDDWATLPDPPKDFSFGSRGSYDGRSKKGKDDEKEFYKKIGGPWAERFSLGLVSPSVVPNYFPTLRIMEYNISGLGETPLPIADNGLETMPGSEDAESFIDIEEEVANSSPLGADNKQKMKEKRRKFKKPKGPSRSGPPGPAYSPQTFTWLGYRQLYANLTVINNDFTSADSNHHGYKADGDAPPLSDSRWKEGKHPNKEPKKKHPGGKPHPKDFLFELEYDTRNDSIYGMEYLTVRSYVELAWRIGLSKKTEEEELERDEKVTAGTKKHKKGKKDKKDKKGKHDRRKKHRQSAWLAFVRRAFVGARDEEDLEWAYGGAAASPAAQQPGTRAKEGEGAVAESVVGADADAAHGEGTEGVSVEL